jgi:hypothetical protein
MAGGMAQVVQCMPIKCKGLSSNPSTAKKKKKLGRENKENRKNPQNFL